jgi:hypothetical protein
VDYFVFDFENPLDFTLILKIIISMKFCSNCGTELLSAANFCPSCGAKVNASNTEGVVDNSSSIKSNGKQVNSNTGFTKNQKLVMITAVILFVIVIIGIIGVKIGSNHDGAETPTADSGQATTYVDESGAVVPMDSSMGSINDQNNSAEEAAVTQRNMAIRNNWEDYILVTRSSFNYSELGGISNLSIIVTNKTEYVLDRVYVDVDIKTVNGYTYKTEHLMFEDIKPYSRAEQYVKPTDRGKTVEYRITNVYSDQLNFKWDEGDNTGNGSLNDPWKYND